MGSYAKLILEDVKTWSKEYLEIPNVHLNKMPACPFARQAWRDNKVWIEIRDPDQGYRRQLLNLVRKLDYTEKEILIFCDPYFKEYGLNRFQKIIDSFNDKWNIEDHYFMGFHPNNPATEEEQEFLVSPKGDDVEMPESKVAYSMMLIQKFSQLYEASDRLKRMGYYKKWPKEYYNEVVDSRQKTYKKLFLKGAKNGQKNTST